MFWKKKITVVLAAEDFQRLMQLVRRYTFERAPKASEDDIYRETIFAFSYMTHCLHATGMKAEEIEKFVGRTALEIMQTFKVRNMETFDHDCNEALSSLRNQAMSYVDASRDYYQELSTKRKREIAEQDFVVMCSTACTGIIKKLELV